eukprot:SAG11_NODE_14701_length_602_cov_1.864811_1_plen_110_part_00
MGKFLPLLLLGRPTAWWDRRWQQQQQQQQQQQPADVVGRGTGARGGGPVRTGYFGGGYELPDIFPCGRNIPPVIPSTDVRYYATYTPRCVLVGKVLLIVPRYYLLKLKK